MAYKDEKSGWARQSDADLVRLCTAGDAHVFAELVRRHSGGLRTCLRRMGAQGADADDMAQEALMMAYEHLTDYRFDGPFAGWLRRIAVRRYLRRIRCERRYWLVEDMTDYVEAEPEASMDTAMRSHDLDAALARLRPVERLCVSLGFAVGLSHQEIACELNLPLGTVKSHIRRALARLKVILLPDRFVMDESTDREIAREEARHEKS